MFKRVFVLIFVFVLLVIFPIVVLAHPGRTDANGCHTNKKTGEYHCHSNAPVVEAVEARTEARMSANIEARTEAPAPQTIQQTNNTEQKYVIERVVDGDTFVVLIDGASKTVRLIGLDTPETVDPRKPVQCFGQEASNKAKELLSTQKVRLEADASQGDFDKYGRLLRYAFLENGTLFNKWMIANGYGHEYTYNLPYKYQVEFKEAERLARENKLGLWADNACKVNTTTTTVNNNDSNNNLPSPFSCGSKTKCGEMISCEEARFYLNNCGVSRLDADKDGIPCESLCK